MNKIFTIWLFSIALFLVCGVVDAQTPYLERSITISLVDEPIEQALKKISEKGGFTFSYNPAILDPGKIITFDFINKTVRQILDQLFSGTVQYKQRGKYIILTRAEYSSSQEGIYSGYIIDEATGEKLKGVSVYDPVSLSSTITNSYGYFEIKIDKPSSDLKLAIKKYDYTDTLVVVPSGDRLLNIPMKFNTDKIETFADSVGKKIKRFWKTKILVPPKINMNNIRDTIYRDTQFSFVPFIGTNHALSGNVINQYSLNLLGGYSLGVTKLEVGGLFNIDRGDMRYFQFAGLFNMVGGNVRGFQFAGIFNANRGTTNGGQFAGIYNFNWGRVDKFSAAGILNFSRDGSDAVQAAGIGNITIGEQNSPHMAGLFNLTTRSASTQAAGLFNLAAKDVTGAQLAGFFNLAGKNVEGTQVAGLFNISGKKIKGAQIAGIFNFAKKVRGAQVGVINVSDSIGGVPIGLLSIAFKGYHKFEFSADEVFYSNFAFRTGVRQFYNILTVGAKPSTFKSDQTFWTFGYGFGTAPKLSKKLFLNLDVTSNQVVQGNSIDAVNLINKFYLGFDYQFLKKASLTFGATLNMQVIDAVHEGYWDLFTDYRPNIFYNRTSHDINTRMWIGGKVGVRFL